MDFYQELLFTAIVSILIVFLIGKLVTGGSPGEEADLTCRNLEAAPVSPPASAVGSDPIEEEAPEGKPSGDPCRSGVSLAEHDRTEVATDEGVRGIDPEHEHVGEKEVSAASGVSLAEPDHTEVAPGEGLRGVDPEHEHVGEEEVVSAAAAEVDVPTVEESPVKKNDEFAKQEEQLNDEPPVVEDRKVEKVAELSGEDVVEKEDAGVIEEEKEATLLDGEDDWEGIERSELQKLFGIAFEFVSSENGGDAVSKLSNDVQMQLYGLQKVAAEGPCYEAQPMALMVSARSKWHAWQRLGNMNPEAAMEQYINLLTDSIPGWMAEESRDKAEGHGTNDPLAAKVSQTDQHDSESSPHDKSETEGLVGDSYSTDGATDIVATGPKLFKEGLTKLFLFDLISPTRVAF